MFSEGACQTLRATGAGDSSNLDLGETKGGVFGGVDDVALKQELGVTWIRADGRILEWDVGGAAQEGGAGRRLAAGSANGRSGIATCCWVVQG